MAGVDLGVLTMATLSTGERITGAQAHTVVLSRLQRLSRSLSLKGKGSENRKKAKAQRAKLHARLSISATMHCTSSLQSGIPTSATLLNRPHRESLEITPFAPFCGR